MKFKVKIVVSVLVFSIISLHSMVVFAQSDSNICNRIDRGDINCDDDLKSISENSEMKKCSQSVISKFQKIVNDCDANLKKEKDEKEQKIENIENQENAADRALANIGWSVQKLNTEIAGLNLSISQLESEVKTRKKAIDEFDAALLNQRNVLSKTVRQVYEYDVVSCIEMILGDGNFSDFSEKLMEMEKLQTGLQMAMEEIREAKKKMDDEKAELEQKKEEKVKYKSMQELSKQNLASKKVQQEYLVKKLGEAKTPLEREIARIETELIELKSAMARIQSYLSQWVIDDKITWSTIFSAVNRASSATGVRSALLLGVLQIESRFGTGLGVPGHYKEYCNWGWGSCNHIDVLLEICNKYGYDPNDVPMSTACAIGPAQFLPCTWKGYAGLNNPWNLNDAVMAMATYLARNGAVSGNERGALLVYNHSEVYASNVLVTANAWQEVINLCGFNLSCPEMQDRVGEKFGGIPAQ